MRNATSPSAKARPSTAMPGIIPRRTTRAAVRKRTADRVERYRLLPRCLRVELLRALRVPLGPFSFSQLLLRHRLLPAAARSERATRAQVADRAVSGSAFTIRAEP